MKTTTHITLTLVGNQWQAQWTGPEAAKLIALFGSDIIPTPFTAATTPDEVIKEIAERNPSCCVVLGEDIQRRIQSRIFRGELDATDADGIQTMRDLQ